MDIKGFFLDTVRKNGGYKVLHAHFDKSNVVTPDILMQAQKESMQDKWDTYNKIKANYTFQDIYERSEKALHSLIKQNVSLKPILNKENVVRTLPEIRLLGQVHKTFFLA